jgi:hypothetical protein
MTEDLHDNLLSPSEYVRLGITVFETSSTLLRSYRTLNNDPFPDAE